LSNVLVTENKFSEAIPPLTRYIGAHPSDYATIVWRASLYLKIRQVPEAVADLTKAATAGLSDAQNQLGVLYLTGIPGFMEMDARNAVVWLRKTAAQGNVQAQYNLPKAEKLVANINEAK
jgi:TPR repeat protein